MFADQLKRLREDAGISQYELARRAGLSKQAMSQLELGQRQPSWATVVKLAEALDVSVEAFVEPKSKAPKSK